VKRALNEVERVGLLIRLEQSLPVALPDDHAVADDPCVSEEVVQAVNGYRARDVQRERVAVSGLIGAIDEVARFLKFNREKESGTDVDTLDLAAPGVCAARLDLVRPEGEARRIGLAVQEVMVVLADEPRGHVNRVNRRLLRVVRDLQRGYRARTECDPCAGDAEEADECRLSPLDIWRWVSLLVMTVSR
jgi:hypothetical protein